ncbi:MAG: aminopeptidase, partial [Candidatus Aenigmarchaeota archaeon]|nr:aminopeptidase [Candidatus Aenigmarchaeota archaeon]
MLNFRIARAAGKKKDDVSFIPVFKEDVSRFSGLGKEALAVFRESRFKGDKLESMSINIPGEHVVVVGLGKRSEVTGELLRRYGALCYLAGETLKRGSAYVSADLKCRLAAKDAVRCVSEGLILSSYRFDKYITEKDKKKRELKDIFVVSSYPGAADTLRETVTVCRGTFMVRDLVNENAKDKTPEKLERFARSIAKDAKLKLTVIDEKQMKKLGMELILAVNSGSSYPPRLVIIEYKGNPGSKDKTVLVGKGITFDSGGINLKPTGFVEDMKSDMGGAAVVLGTVKTAADLKIKRNIIAVMPLTENAIGSKSYKPGDIYSSYSGKTVEIKNT